MFVKLYKHNVYTFLDEMFLLLHSGPHNIHHSLLALDLDYHNIQHPTPTQTIALRIVYNI